MGFLSESAKGAFKKGRRRAHIPDWFEPVGYVFAGVSVTVVAVLALTADPAPPTRPARPAPAPVTVPATPDTSSAPDGSTIPTVDGVPAAAVTVARAATEALFTGKFAGVPIYPGQEQPVLLRTWPAPVIGQLVSAETFPDGTVVVTHTVDPDGAGADAPRNITVIVASTEQGWAYLPG